MEAVTGGECSFKVMVFKDETGEEETGQRRLDGELEGDNPTLRFDFTQVREGDTRQRMVRWCTGRGSAGSSVRRWEKTPGWADLVQRPERLDWQGDSHGKNQAGLLRILG
jgi:hypothetical protein